MALASRYLGIELATDTCDDDKPAAPVFDAPAAPPSGNDLPSATIKIDRRSHR